MKKTLKTNASFTPTLCISKLAILQAQVSSTSLSSRMQKFMKGHLVQRMQTHFGHFIVRALAFKHFSI